MIANKLNEHFVNKGPKLAKKIKKCNITIHKFLKKRNRSAFRFFLVTEREIIKIVNELVNGKSAGYDQISSQILKLCIPYIKDTLYYHK